MICDVDIAALSIAQPEKRPGLGVKMELLARVSDGRGDSCFGYSFSSAMDAPGNIIILCQLRLESMKA